MCVTIALDLNTYYLTVFVVLFLHILILFFVFFNC